MTRCEVNVLELKSFHHIQRFIGQQFRVRS